LTLFVIPVLYSLIERMRAGVVHREDEEEAGALPPGSIAASEPT
jgi:hypothetical protein